jgi:hypothetical protein
VLQGRRQHGRDAREKEDGDGGAGCSSRDVRGEAGKTRRRCGTNSRGHAGEWKERQQGNRSSWWRPRAQGEKGVRRIYRKVETCDLASRDEEAHRAGTCS